MTFSWACCLSLSRSLWMASCPPGAMTTPHSLVCIVHSMAFPGCGEPGMKSSVRSPVRKLLCATKKLKRFGNLQDLLVAGMTGTECPLSTPRDPSIQTCWLGALFVSDQRPCTQLSNSASFLITWHGLLWLQSDGEGLRETGNPAGLFMDGADSSSNVQSNGFRRGQTKIDQPRSVGIPPSPILFLIKLSLKMNNSVSFSWQCSKKELFPCNQNAMLWAQCWRGLTKHV